MTAILRSFPGAIALLVLIVPHALAQDSLYLGDGPEWEFADSNLVQDPPWTSGTVPKNIVVLSFKNGTPPARRTAVIRKVHGTIVHIDTLTDVYLMRVATHPDACGVKQAIDLLSRLPDVAMALADLALTTNQHGSMDPGSGLITLPVTHHGSRRPCPTGIGLLR